MSCFKNLFLLLSAIGGPACPAQNIKAPQIMMAMSQVLKHRIYEEMESCVYE
jgi:hypothetical protein